MSSSTNASATDPGDRSSAEIEREVEATRARLTDTLEELRDRTSPGQLFEQAVDYFRSSGGTEFARNLGAQVRDNPLPLLLIGAGIGWLMLGGGNDGRRSGGYRDAGPYRALPPPSTGERPMARIYGEYGEGGTYARPSSGGPSVTERASQALGDAKDRVAGTAAGMRDSVAGAAGRAGDMASSTYESVTGAASDAARRAGDAASSAYESVTDAASDAARRVGDMASSAYESVTGAAGSATSSASQQLSSLGQGAREQAGYLGDQAREGLGWVVREQPLVLGAIGLALGAAVGALLPGTETEDRLMGETRDELAERAAATAQQAYEQVKDTAGEHLERAKAAAGEVYEGTKQRLDEGGLSAGRVGEALGAAAREAREAVRDVAKEASGQAQGAMGGSDDATAAKPTQTATAAPAGNRTADPVTNPGTEPQPSPRQSNPL